MRELIIGLALMLALFGIAVLMANSQLVFTAVIVTVLVSVLLMAAYFFGSVVLTIFE